MRIIKKSATPINSTTDLEELEQAKSEWEHARIYFNSVTDAELIDFAAYNLEAARRRYIYRRFRTGYCIKRNG